ncbi:MAG: hypothetical protein PHT07_16160 [Paludibacter sp.]|nr:hypothetical protein [Paludibacter sp.]
MYKLLIVILFFCTFNASQGRAQESLTLPAADSITYQYFMKGDWEKLIITGKESIKQHIDFKWLRQRMGYAYFIKADYYASEQQYEKALAFDKSDTLTITYLYYCGLYTGNDSYARYQARKLPVTLQKQLGVKQFRILDALDAEYNYKINSISSRSNPGYYRIGVNSQPGYRLNLYQAFSTYSQQIDSAGIRQNEYFALVNYSLNSHVSLDLGYHYIGTSISDTSTYRVSRMKKETVINSTFYPGHLFYSKLSYRKNRFDIGISASVLKYDSILTQQYGLQAGVVLPGKLNIYLKSSLYGMLDPNTRRLIYSQSVGALLCRKVWAEGEITFGNLKNFSDTNGLYVYNSNDVTTFRAGLSLFWYVTKKVTLFGNYSFNRKEYENNYQSTSTYNQQSLSSGIIWKI